MDTYSKIEQLMVQKGISAYRLSKETGISTGLLSQWKKRSQSPSLEKLQLIADYFNVSLDYFLGKTSIKKEMPALTKKDEPEITFDDFTYALHAETQELTEENKQKLLEMAKLFKLSQEQNKDKK